MDHHCPWTSNCVSATVFPHFLRFLFWACTALTILDCHLYQRSYAIYEQRNLPSYLGPSVTALVLLGLLILVANLTLFALSILLVTSIHSLVINTTIIEQWEIERHEALVHKSRASGGYVYASGGVKLRILHQEFPYDIGMWSNVVQGMGSNNPIAWFLPFAGGPDNRDCWSFETNEFENPGETWPPVDPDRMSRPLFRKDVEDNHVGDVAAFKSRQEADMKRWERPSSMETRKQEMHRATMVSRDDEDVVNDNMIDDDYESEYEEGMDGEEGWTSRDGSRLRDFGVDEDAEVDQIIEIDDEDEEDNIPLAELIRRRKILASSE